MNSGVNSEVNARNRSEMTVTGANTIARQETQPRGTNPTTEPAKILVLDDEAYVRQMVAEILTREGHVVYLADGKNAEAMLTGEIFNLVITDLRMPGMRGIDVLALAKQTSPNAKLIVITGYPSKATLDEGLEMGAEAYITKPFHVAELRSVVRRVLKSKPSAQQRKAGADAG